MKKTLQAIVVFGVIIFSAIQQAEASAEYIHTIINNSEDMDAARAGVQWRYDWEVKNGSSDAWDDLIWKFYTLVDLEERGMYGFESDEGVLGVWPYEKNGDMCFFEIDPESDPLNVIHANSTRTFSAYVDADQVAGDEWVDSFARSNNEDYHEDIQIPIAITIDLLISNVSYIAGAYHTGDEFVVTASEVNAGNTPITASEPFLIQMVFSPTTNWNDPASILIYEFTEDEGLDAGEVYEGTFTNKLSNTEPTGNYYLGIMIDVNDDVDEGVANETNNVWWSDSADIVIVEANELIVRSGTGDGWYTNGEVVAVSANAASPGQVFDRWLGDTQHVGNVSLASTTVTMPAQDVTLSATYVDDYDHPPGLTALGTLFDDPTADAEAIVYSNDYAYVACGYAGLIVFDVSDPVNPVRVGGYDTEGFAKALTLQSNRVFIADDEFGLQIINVTTPSTPVLAGNYQTYTDTEEVAVSGNYVYMAAGHRGLQIFDISTISAPELVGEYNTPDWAYGVSVVGSYAYVADDDGGLKIIDVSTPTAPVLAGSYTSLYRSYDVDVQDGYAYVADYTNGLQVIDVSDPANPTYVGGYVTKYGYDVFVEGAYAYLANGGYGVEIVDISNPSVPTSADKLYSGYANGVFVADGKAYVANDSRGLLVVDVSTPSDISQLGAYDTHRYSYDVAIKGSYAYLAALSDGVITVDISNPDAPVVVATNKNMSYAYRLDMVDDTLYVAASYEGLVVYDLSNPAAPSFVTKYDFVTSGYIRDVKVSGNYAYCANDYYRSTNSLGIVDVSDPSNPVYVGGYNTGDSAYGVDVKDNMVYLASDSNGLQIFDVSNPANPILKGGYKRPSNPYARSVSVDGDYAYVLDNNDVLQIVDIQNPENPTLHRKLDLGYLWASQSDVFAEYPYVYIAWADGNYPENNGLWVVDVRDTDNLIVTNVPTSGFARGVAVSGGYVYLADDPKALHIFTLGEKDATGLAIDGPSLVNENSTNIYTCGVTYTDGSLSNVTDAAVWSLLGDAHGTTLDGNELTVPAVISDETITIQAIYGGFTNTVEVGFNMPTNLFISGSSVLIDDSTNLYSCTLQYPDGSVTKATDLATWSISGDAHGATLNSNELSIGTIASDQTVTIQAVYGSLTNTRSVLLKVIPPGLTPLGTLFDDPTDDAEETIVSNGYAYVACGYAGLVIFDVSNPANPVRVGGYDTAGESVGLAMRSNLVFVADGSGGLSIVDVSTPSSPTLAGSWQAADFSGTRAKDITLSGRYAYIAAMTRGLLIIDIDDVSNPQLIGEMPVDYYAMSVAVDGNYVYVADFREGLKIADISNPTNPVLVSSYADLVQASVVVKRDDYLYIADYTNGLQILDVSDPTSPVHVGGYVTKYGYDVFVKGDYAYMANHSYGVEIVDISNPANPVPVGEFDDNSGYAQRVFVVGDVAYVSNREGGLQILDVSVPTSISKLGSYDTHRYSYDVAVKGSYAYLAAYRDGLITVDISTPSSPMAVFTNKWTSRSYAYNLDMDGDYAYVASGGYGLTVFDVSIPSTPSLVSAYDLGYESVRDVKVLGDYAFCANSYYSDGRSTNALCVVDISEPSSPVYIGGYNNGGRAYGVDVQGQYAYLAAYTNGLQIIDISNPTNPVFAGSYGRLPFTEFDSQTSRVKHVGVSGQYAYLVDSGNTLEVINVSDPQNPIRSGFCHLGWADSVNLFVQYPYVYIAAIPGGFGKIGLWIVDVSDPENPVVAVDYPTSGYSRGVTVEHGHVYLADDTKALYTFMWGAVPTPTKSITNFAVSRFPGGKSRVDTLSTKTTNSYEGIVEFSDKTMQLMTTLATWSVVGDAYGTVFDEHRLTADNITSNGAVITVQGSYGGFSDTLDVTLYNDRDNNGIPDWWEILYYSGATRANPSATCSNGVNSVWQAYIAGLDPNDPDSAFLTSLLPGNELQWNTASGRVYSVWWTTNLLENFQPLETNLPWTQGSYTNPDAPPCSYYKINVELEE